MTFHIVKGVHLLFLEKKLRENLAYINSEECNKKLFMLILIFVILMLSSDLLLSWKCSSFVAIMAHDMDFHENVCLFSLMKVINEISYGYEGVSYATTAADAHCHCSHMSLSWEVGTNEIRHWVAEGEAEGELKKGKSCKYHKKVNWKQVGEWWYMN